MVCMEEFERCGTDFHDLFFLMCVFALHGSRIPGRRYDHYRTGGTGHRLLCELGVDCHSPS